MRLRRGFTLIELLVVIGVIGMLASFLYVNFNEANEKGRDARRQADLRSLQSAIELYKQRYGYYPAGCRGANNWSGGTYGCPSGTEYIVGLAPEFIARLPFDPSPGTGTNRGYVYVSNRDTSNNTSGEVYKLMVMNTVESEVVTREHEFASCDMSTISFAPPEYTTSGTRSMCGQVIDEGNSTPDRCQESNARFMTSYAVWNGYATKTTSSNVYSASNGLLDLTQNIICK